VNFGKIIERMPHIRLDEAVGYHGVEELAFDVNPLAFEHAQVEFQVVPDFFNAPGLQQNAQFLGERLRRCLIALKGEEKCTVGLEGKCDPARDPCLGSLLVETALNAIRFGPGETARGRPVPKRNPQAHTDAGHL